MAVTTGSSLYSLSNKISTWLPPVLIVAKPAVSLLNVGLPTKFTSPLKITLPKNSTVFLNTSAIFLEIRSNISISLEVSLCISPAAVATPATRSLNRLSFLVKISTPSILPAFIVSA
ncbi:TPA: hypothetical protein DCP77_01070 [Candidatus Collierbacteria bacterium]|nr:hypothetical protein [Candidatus Collierbacteria bacterium]